MIEGVIGFLSGDTQSIQRELEQRMREAAADERFEEAARYRNRLNSIRHLAERQAADRRDGGDRRRHRARGRRRPCGGTVFPLRDGKMIDRYGFHLENVAGEDEQTVLEAFVIEYYGTAPSIPPQVFVPASISDTSALAEFLSERRGARVEVRAPLRGEKRRLVELAVENAASPSRPTPPTARRSRSPRRGARGAPRVLNLESLPVRIECFDVSNIQGEAIVASMVVFQDGRPKNAHYRTFTIRGLEGQDDVGAMREAIPRRFARARTGDVDESFAASRTSSSSTAARASSPRRSPRWRSSTCRASP